MGNRSKKSRSPIIMGRVEQREMDRADDIMWRVQMAENVERLLVAGW